MKLGVYNDLMDECFTSQPDLLKQMSGLNALPTKSKRWIGEMLEISSTFKSAGITGSMHKGAAEIFNLISETDLAINQTPENYDKEINLEDIIRVFANHLDHK